MGATLELWCSGFSMWWLLLFQALALWQEGSVIVSMDLIALWHVGSSRTRDLTLVPCSGRWILSHWTTKEVLTLGFQKTKQSLVSISYGAYVLHKDFCCSHHRVCKILVPPPGINPCPLQWKHRFITTGLSGNT